ncbi:MAG: Lrp/AsnC family transcriptional regulator [Euryarchaeota archaeon]|nr:Lrp/AsnC family transcriptional regulator [Euryarchaeota archaeon]
MSPELDDKDRLILKALREDAGQSTTRLAKRLALPRTTVHERIVRLQEEGVIRRHTILVDHAKLGRPVTAFIFMSFASGYTDQRTLANQVAQLPGVSEVFVISGEWDILVKVRAESLEGMGRLILDRLREMPGVGRSMTVTSFETIKEEP